MVTCVTAAEMRTNQLFLGIYSLTESIWPVFLLIYASTNKARTFTKIVMEQQDWKKVERVLDKVLAVENPKQKKEMIKDACKEDQQLYEEIIRLLKNIQKAEEQGFLDLDR